LRLGVVPALGLGPKTFVEHAGRALEQSAAEQAAAAFIDAGSEILGANTEQPRFLEGRIDFGARLAQLRALLGDGGDLGRLAGGRRRAKLRQAAVHFGETRIEDVKAVAQSVANGRKLFAQLGEALISVTRVPDGLLELIEKLLERRQVGCIRNC
jgi:hypothetical protein